MKLAITSVPVPAPGTVIDVGQVADIVGGHTLTTLQSHVVGDAQGRPQLVLVVATGAPRRPVDPAASLDAEALARYDALRAWRNRRAIELGTAAYLVVSNRALAGVAERLPADKPELLEVKGLGHKKVALWGDELLAEVAALTGAPPAVAAS